MVDLHRKAEARADGNGAGSLAFTIGIDPADFTRFLKHGADIPVHALANLAHELGLDVGRVLLSREVHYCKDRSLSADRNGKPISKERRMGWERASEAYSLLAEGRSIPTSLRSPSYGSLANWKDWVAPVT